MHYRNIGTRLLIKDVFPDTLLRKREDMIGEQLSYLTIIETLHCCAYLNYFVSKDNAPLRDLHSQIPLLRLFLPENRIRAITRVAPNAQIKNVYKLEPSFFDRHQLLELMRQVVLHCPDKGYHPTQTSASKRTFIKSALLAGEMVQDNIWGQLNPSMDSNKMSEYLWGPTRESARLGTRTKNILQEFVRGFQLYDNYLPMCVPDFKSRFEEITGLSIKQYYGCHFLMAMPSTLFLNGKQSPGSLILSRELYCQDNIICQLMDKYLKRESYTIDQFRDAVTKNTEHPLKPFREKPILRLVNGNSLVLDQFFHTEKASFGPLFAVSSEIKQIMKEFGNAFEKYAQNILLTIATRSKIDCVLNQKLSTKGNELGELDSVLIYENYLILFEIKGKWVKDYSDISNNKDEYLNDLHIKYGEGAGQLARAIVNLTTNRSSASIQRCDISNIRNILPILVTLDSSFTIPGYTQYFEKEFSTEIQKSGHFTPENKMFNYQQWLVSPLAVVTIDILEILQGSTKNFSIIQLLQDYANHRNNSPYKHEDTSLADFLNWSKYRKLLSKSDEMRDTTMTYIKDIFEQFVPEPLKQTFFDESNGDS